MLTRTHFLVSVFLLTSSVVAAEQWWKQGMGGERNYRKFAVNDLSIDVPTNWQPLVVAAPTIAAFSKDTNASVSISRERFEHPVLFNELFTKYETQLARDAAPAATDLAAIVVEHYTLGRMLRMEYSGPDPVPPRRGSPRPFRFIHFVIPAGSSVYRIVCGARADEFAKLYAPTFARMMDSLTIASATKPGLL